MSTYTPRRRRATFPGRSSTRTVVVLAVTNAVLAVALLVLLFHLGGVS